MEPNYDAPYHPYPPHDPAWNMEESSVYTRQFYGNPFFFFPPPIIPIVPFPPFFGRFPYRRRFFW